MSTTLHCRVWVILEGTSQPRRPGRPSSQGLLSNHLQNPPLGGDPEDRSNNLFCSSGVSFPEPSGGGWYWVWLCWHQFSIFVLNMQNWAPRAELHVKPGALALSQTDSNPVLPMPLEPLNSSSRLLWSFVLKGPLSDTTMVKCQKPWFKYKL